MTLACRSHITKLHSLFQIAVGMPKTLDKIHTQLLAIKYFRISCVSHVQTQGAYYPQNAREGLLGCHKMQVNARCSRICDRPSFDEFLLLAGQVQPTKSKEGKVAMQQS